MLEAGKHPERKGWQENAGETSLEEMRKVCNPANGRIGVVINQGIRTGVEIRPGFNLVVVEGDSSEGCRWIEGFGVAGTRTSITRRGRHYYLSVPADVEVHNATDIVPDVDVRGEGGFVVSPGSIHVTGHVYRWAQEAPVQEMPPALLEYILDRQKEINKKSGEIVDNHVRGSLPSGEIRVGTRHDVLLRIAASLRSRGHDEESLSSSMRAINAESREEPLPPEEVDEIVEYALLIKPKRTLPSRRKNSNSWPR